MKQFTDYEKTETRKALEKKLDYHRAFFQGWNAVTRNYKKDGKPFENLIKNFNGLTIHNKAYSLIPGKELTMCVQTDKSGYQTETIDNYELVKYSDIKPDDNRIIDEPCLEKYFYLTADEIENKINKRKEYHARRINELEKAIKENDRDNETAAALLDYIRATLEKVNPDAASIYKEKLIRNFY